MGFIPPDKTTLKCTNTLSKAVAKLWTCITTCQMNAADAALAHKPFDEDACERTDPKKSCLAKYDKTAAKLTATPGKCPPCLAAPNLAALADATRAGARASRGEVYCAGSTPF